MTANATFSIFRAGFLLCLAFLCTGPAAYAGPNPVTNNGVANFPAPPTSQRLDDSRARAESDRLVLYLSGAFAAFGFLAIVFAAGLHWTVVKRLAGALDQLRAGAVPTDVETPSIRALKQTIAQLERAIERLERVTAEIKSPAAVPPPDAEPVAESAANGTTPKRPEKVAVVVTPPAPVVPDEIEKIALFMGKGRSLLALNQPENALECFEQVLALDDGNADVWVKKGSALEQMQKWNDALEAFDRAIALDEDMTIAYLRKGAVLNRLQRHESALECYERALATQEKSAPRR